MNRLVLPKIYPITDTRISGLSHIEQVKRLIDGGATLIQIREKSAPSGEFYDAALQCVAYARERGVRMIINDRVDIAMATGADGVHLGQDDLSPGHARRLLGPDAIIGYSTHSIEQARTAIALPVDYIAIGPVFGTTTKDDADAVVGVVGVRAVRAAITDFPLVAIGGISADTAKEVLDAGADSVAIISDILKEPARIADRMAALTGAT